METADIVLAFVSIISGITGIIVKSIMKDIKDLEHSMTSCQANMPKDYVMKSDYKGDIAEIKSMLSELYTLARGKK